MRSPVLSLFIALILQCSASLAQTAGKLAEVPFDPKIVGFANNEAYGAIGNKIFIQGSNGFKWKEAFVLPFAADSGTLLMTDNKTILFSRFDDSLFYFSIADAKVQKREKKEMLEAFCKSQIQQLIFRKGAYGCFASYSDEMIYERRNGKFQWAGKKAHGSKHTSLLPDNEDEIDEQVVDEFVKNIPVIYKKQADINDLEFTETEYNACKKNIRKFKKDLEAKKDLEENEGSFTINDKNPNFERLIALVDSIKTLDKSLLNKHLLFLNDVISTGGTWARVVLVNTNNERLVIENNSNGHNTFYFPWQVQLNGSKSINSAIEINKFVADVYPDFLSSPSKVELLQQLVKFLYNRHH